MEEGVAKTLLLPHAVELLVFVTALIPVHYWVKWVSEHATLLVESGGPTRLCASEVPASSQAQAHMADSAQHTLFCEKKYGSDPRASFLGCGVEDPLSPCLVESWAALCHGPGLGSVGIPRDPGGPAPSTACEE